MINETEKMPVLRGGAVNFNSIAKRNFYFFDLDNPCPVEVALSLRGNALLGVYRGDRLGGLGEKLESGDDYTLTQNGVLIHTGVFSGLAAGSIAMLTAVFERGASIALPVFVHRGPLPGSAVIFDPREIKKPENEKMLIVDNAVYVPENAPGEESECLRILYDARAGSKRRRPAVRINTGRLYGTAPFSALTQWVWGDGSGNRLGFFIKSREGAPIHSKNEYIINWHGWKKLAFFLGEDYSPPGSLRHLFEFSYTKSGALSGEVRLGIIEAVYDMRELPSDLGRPVRPAEPPEDALWLDYRGGTIGETSEFFLRSSSGELPQGWIELRVLDCVQKDGAEYPFAPERLVFDAKGRLFTDAFTQPSFPNDLLFSLQAVCAGGERSQVMPFNAARRESVYTLRPPSPFSCVTADPARSAAFCWFGDDAKTPARAELYEANSPQSAKEIKAQAKYAREYISFYKLGKRDVCLNRDLCAYSVNIDGLLPGREYKLRFFTGERGSEEFSYRTFPARADAFDLVLLADAQIKRDDAAYARLRETLTAALSRAGSPRLIATLGDMVDRAGCQPEYAALSEYLSPYLTGEIWMRTPGNHEQEHQRGFENYLNHFEQTRNTFPRRAGGSKNALVHSVTLGDYAIISAVGSGNELSPKYADALREELSSLKTKWKIVLTHASPYGKSGERFTLQYYAPLFDSCGVDLVLSGHDHIYIRSSVRGGKRTEFGSGVTYVTLGPCGSANDKYARFPWHDYVYGDDPAEVTDSNGAPDQMYALVHCAPGRLEVDVYTRTGKSVDSFWLEK